MRDTGTAYTERSAYLAIAATRATSLVRGLTSRPRDPTGQMAEWSNALAC